MDLEPEIVGSKSTKNVKVPLNSNDKLYSEIRDLNFSVLGPLLNRKAKEIDQYYKVSIKYHNFVINITKGTT